MAQKQVDLFPGYRISPDGKEYRLFELEEDVPSGWLRETPASFEKKGLGKTESDHKPLRPVSDEHKHVPADYEVDSTPPKPQTFKEKLLGALDL